MPHTHTEDRIYTVISGKFRIGFGVTFHLDELKSVPESGIVFVPKGQPHFQYADAGGYVVQVNGVGPTSTDYVSAEDDPRTTS